MYNLQVQNGVRVLEKIKLTNTQIWEKVKTVEELSTIICKPIGNTKRCQEICQPNCARTNSHLLMWHGFRKGNSFQCDGQREELLYF